MSFKVIIFSSDESVFIKKREYFATLGLNLCVWCDSKKLTRLDIINENLNEWLLFLDHDCTLSEEAVNVVRKATLIKPEQNTVYAGMYLDVEKASYLQRVHNFIANTWLLQSYTFENSTKLVLGGAFLIFSQKKINFKQHDVFWGAEDKAMAYQFDFMDFKISLLQGFKVLHDTSASLQHFVRRAYLHGKNDIKYIINDKNKINYLFWIRKIGFANLNLLPLIVFHFCIQRWAELIQKIHHQSNIKK